MKTMIKLSFVMAAYAVVACVGLAFVYIATAPRIEASAREEVNSALKGIFPDATDFTEVTGKLSSGVQSVVFDRAYVAVKDAAPVGMVVQVTGPTYKNSTILVGVGLDRRIAALKFMANNDTPGLGTKTAKSPFIDQFKSKSVDDAFKSGKDVVAISGATISSKGVAALLKLASSKAGDYLAANHGGPVAADVEASPAPGDGK